VIELPLGLHVGADDLCIISLSLAMIQLPRRGFILQLSPGCSNLPARLVSAMLCAGTPRFLGATKPIANSLSKSAKVAKTSWRTSWHATGETARRKGFRAAGPASSAVRPCDAVFALTQYA